MVGDQFYLGYCDGVSYIQQEVWDYTHAFPLHQYHPGLSPPLGIFLHLSWLWIDWKPANLFIVNSTQMKKYSIVHISCGINYHMTSDQYSIECPSTFKNKFLKHLWNELSSSEHFSFTTDSDNWYRKFIKSWFYLFTIEITCSMIPLINQSYANN